jgi:hypothetical protein
MQTAPDRAAGRPHRTGRRRLKTILPAGAFAALAVIGGVAYFMGRADGRTERAAVDAYVRDLNNGDVTRLNTDIYPANPGAAQTIINEAHRPWSVTSISIVHEFGRDYGVAELWGTAAGTSLHVRLPLLRHDGTWYVAQTSPEPTTGDPSAATAQA